MSEVRVFSILQRGHRYRVDGAEQWGRVVYLFQPESRMNPFAVDTYCASILEALREQNFDRDADLLMLTGSPVATALLASTVASWYGRARLLLFDPQSGNYVERKLDFMELAS